MKDSGVNHHSPYAERLTTLSEIDSAWQNREISKRDAILRAAEISGGNAEVIKAIFRK